MKIPKQNSGVDRSYCMRPYFIVSGIRPMQLEDIGNKVEFRVESSAWCEESCYLKYKDDPKALRICLNNCRKDF